MQSFPDNSTDDQDPPGKQAFQLECTSLSACHEIGTAAALVDLITGDRAVARAEGVGAQNRLPVGASSDQGLRYTPVGTSRLRTGSAAGRLESVGGVRLSPLFQIIKQIAVGFALRVSTEYTSAAAHCGSSHGGSSHAALVLVDGITGDGAIVRAEGSGVTQRLPSGASDQELEYLPIATSRRRTGSAARRFEFTRCVRFARLAKIVKIFCIVFFAFIVSIYGVFAAAQFSS